MAEASFLAAREARNSHRPISATNRKDKQEGLHEFWSSVHAFLKDWNDRLTTLAAADAQEHATINKSESEKRHLQEQFVRLAHEIQWVRKICLSTANSAEATTIVVPSDDQGDNSERSKIIAMISPPPEGDLSLVDTRLLHRELTECQSKLDKTKIRLLPKGKFVFRRYREAVRKRDEQRRQDGLRSDGDNGPTGEDAGSRSELDRENSAELQATQNPLFGTERRALQDLENVDILVDSSGRARLQHRAGDPSRVEAETITFPSNTSTMILRNLNNCTVSLQGIYKSLHMTNVNGSRVQVATAIDGPIHVTHCHTSNFRLSCQQLRLHESTDLIVRLHVAPAGIILEDCNSVVFQCNSNEMHLDIKDFDWLRSGIPSPNFTVETVFEDNVMEPENSKTGDELIAERDDSFPGASSIAELLTPSMPSTIESLPAASSTSDDQTAAPGSDDEL